MPVKGIVTILFDPQLGRLFRTHCDYQNVKLTRMQVDVTVCSAVQVVGTYPSEEHTASVLKVQKRRPELKTVETVPIAVM